MSEWNFAGLARRERAAIRAGGRMLLLAPSLVSALREAYAAGNVRRISALLRLLFPQLGIEAVIVEGDGEATDGRLDAIANEQKRLMAEWARFKKGGTK